MTHWRSRMSPNNNGVSWPTVLVVAIVVAIALYISQRFWFGCSDLFGTCIAIKKPF